MFIKNAAHGRIPRQIASQIASFWLFPMQLSDSDSSEKRAFYANQSSAFGGVGGSPHARFSSAAIMISLSDVKH
jgi:hypothetical protein